MKLAPRSLTTVVAALAVLLLAMGGTAYAAAQITSAQIKDGTIQVKDMSSQARKALKGNKGPKGARGPAGPVALTYVTGPTTTTNAAAQWGASAECPAGTSVTGGGLLSSSGTRGLMNVNSTFPYDTSVDADARPDNAWYVYVDVNDAVPHTITAYAVCSSRTTVKVIGPPAARR